MTLTNKRCYQLLGLPEGSSWVTVREAYQRLALAYHPDRNPAAIDVFQRIRAAYEQLLAELPEPEPVIDPTDALSLDTDTARVPDIGRERRGRRGSPSDRRFEIILEGSYLGTSVRERI